MIKAIAAVIARDATEIFDQLQAIPHRPVEPGSRRSV
jgi:hypothetical protein